MKCFRATAIAVLLAVAACDAAPPAPEGELALLDVVISDDPGTKFARAGTPGFGLAHHEVFGVHYFHGRLMADLQVAISRDGRQWIDLGEPAAVDFALQEEGRIAPLHPAVEVPPGSYAFLRLSGTGGAARLDGGSEIAGEVLEEEATLTIGDAGGLLIETRLSSPIFLPAAGRVTLSVDLNAEGWMSEANVEARRIPATDVETAISVTPHQILPAAVVPPRRGSV